MIFTIPLSKKIKQQLPTALLWLGWVTILTLALLWRLKNIDAFGLTNDEGAYLMWSRLVAEGYSLYSQTHTGSPPLFIEMLALVFKLFGPSIILGRLIVLGWFIILSGVLAYFAYCIAKWPAVYVSTVILAIIPPIFNLSRQVMIELPAMTLALISVGCAYLFFVDAPFWRNKKQGWVFLAGFFLALSLLMKLLHLLVVIPVVYLIWRKADSWLVRTKHIVLFGLGGAITSCVVIAFFDLAPLIDQVIRFRAETRGASIPQPATNLQTFIAYSSNLWGLSLLAVAGLMSSLFKVRGQAWGLWLLANLALVMWYNPLFPHHLSLVLLPSILLAIEFIAFCQDKTHPQRLIQSKWGWAVVILALLNVPALIEINQKTVAITTGGREAEAAKILQQVTRPTDFVMSDSQLLALLADRVTPPPLVDFSLVYIQAGRQTPDRLINMSNEYAVAAVAPWALRMVWLPDYLAWVEQNYWVHKVWDNDHQLYFGRKHPPKQPIPNEQHTQFEKNITLRGYTLDTPSPISGKSLPLTLYWQTTAPISLNYTIFVQVLNASGVLVAQNDSQPLYGYFPTTQWPLNQLIPDRVDIPLPTDLPSGPYAVIVGLYDTQTMTRLLLAGQANDYIQLTTVEIKE